MERLYELLRRNWRIILLTFQIFWIAVFLLEAATRSSGAEITGFVYANF